MLLCRKYGVSYSEQGLKASDLLSTLLIFFFSSFCVCVISFVVVFTTMNYRTHGSAVSDIGVYLYQRSSMLPAATQTNRTGGGCRASSKPPHP